MDTVKIITVQRKAVLDKILTDGIYYADTEKYIAEKAPNLLEPYRYLMREYGYKHFPIFGCQIGYYCEFYGAKCDEKSVLIQLSVPVDEVRLQHYYNWTDLCFFIEVPREWEQDEYPLEQFFKDTLHQNNIQHPTEDCHVHQVTMERIKKTWITDTFPVTEKFSELHDGSGGGNILHELYYYKQRI